MRWIALLACGALSGPLLAAECPIDRNLGQGLRLDSTLVLGPGLLGQSFSGGKSQPTYLFGREISGLTEDQVTLKGEAELRQFGASVRAQSIEVSLVEGSFRAEGEVTLFREGEFFKGDSLTLMPQVMRGLFSSAEYEFSAMNARGSAQRIEFVQPKRTDLKDVSFSTCPRDRPAWAMRSDTLVVDQIREVASSSGSVLLWGGVPVLPLGDLSFPTSDRRRSGFLMPTYAANSELGLEITVPYYWNVAPNRDLTLSPKLISRRGVQVAGEFRYLDPDWGGALEWEYLPDDQNSVDRSNRSLGRIHHRQRLGDDTEFRLQLTRVSDDRYLSDFGGSILASSQRTLPASVALDTQRYGWQFSIIGQDFQLLRNPISPLIAPYQYAPKFTAARESVASDISSLQNLGPLDSIVRLEWTSLNHPTLLDGDRFVAMGGIGLRKDVGPFLTNTRLGVHATHFQRRADGSASGTNRVFGIDPLNTLYRFNVTDDAESLDSYQRIIPTLSFDGRVLLERDAKWAGDRATQTLEPRLLYVKTPYRDQSRYPVFDTGPQTTGLSQLLSDRVYTGNDRVADQDHLTGALTSRVVSGVSGEEVLTTTVAQRHYFATQRVILPGELSRDDRESDVLAELSLRYSRALSGSLFAQYTPSSSRWQAGSASVAYTPRAGQVVSASYRYQRETFDSVDLAFQAPVHRNWYAVGRFNYSFQDDDSASILQREGLVEGLLGAEYDGGCWVGRIVLQQFVSSATNKTSAIFFQIEFNGLGRIGTDPLAALKRSVPNYTMINQIHSPPARFENFQ